MIGKAVLLGSVTLSTALYVGGDAAVQPLERNTAPPGASQADLVERVRALGERLAEHEARSERLLDEAMARAERAEARAASLVAELDECWIAAEQRHDRNCSPSRASIVRYRRLKDEGDADRAERLLDQMVQQIGRGNDDLNGYTWSLLTGNERIEGRDELAFDLARRMQSRPNQLSHYMIDTIALAYYRVGRVEEAIELQREAIARGGERADYLQRLRQYEGAPASLGQLAGR